MILFASVLRSAALTALAFLRLSISLEYRAVFALCSNELHSSQPWAGVDFGLLLDELPYLVGTLYCLAS